jgi:hypothetical protein
MNYRTKPKGKEGHQYSAEEVAEAVRKFRESGGPVRKFPDEIVIVDKRAKPRRIENFSGYENLGGFSYVEDYGE